MKKVKACTFMVLLIILIGMTQSVLANPLPVYEVYWMDRHLFTSEISIKTELKVDTWGNTKLAAYGIRILYDPEMISPNTNFGINGVEAGENGFVAAANIVTPGVLKISGFDVNGEADMTLFEVLWYIKSSGAGSKKNLIDMEIDLFANENSEDIPFAVDRKSATIIAGKLLGDVNGDMQLDIIDALITAGFYVGNIYPDFDFSVADVNCDGSIDIIDALLIAQYYVESITSIVCS